MKIAQSIKLCWKRLSRKKIVEKIEQADWRKISVGALVVALTLVAVSVWNLARQGYFGNAKDRMSNDEQTAEVTAAFRHPFTGAPNATAIATPNVYAVMIENSADAWPQSGVNSAFLVIEAPTEGAIPRLLAFYSGDQDVDEIGPVRSARPYFIDWASAWQSLYAHVGGSPAAVNELASTEALLDFDEFYNQYQFWRSPTRSMPHNVYTSLALLREGRERRYAERERIELETYIFKNDSALSDRPTDVADVTVDFGALLYRVRWVYDQATNSYQRLANNSPHLMADGTALIANNVVIVQTAMTVLDEIGRLKIQTIGEGEALLLQDGLVSTVRWEKVSEDALLRFYGSDGNEVAFNAGQTWVEVIAR